MSADRLAVLEQRLAAVERAVAELGAKSSPPAPGPRKDPLEGHPLIGKKLPPKEAAEREAQRRKELGIDHVNPIGAEKLQQMLLEAGWDPNTTEFSRGIIEMREE